MTLLGNSKIVLGKLAHERIFTLSLAISQQSHIIERKAEPFMTGQASPTLLRPHQTTRNELPRLAHDDIGACKRASSLVVPH